MKKSVLAIAIVFALVSSAHASPTVGDLVRYRVATSQYNLAFVVRIVSGSTVDLVVFTDGTQWQDTNDPPNYSTITYYAKTPGTSVGQYAATTIVEDVITAAGFALTSSVTSAIAAATSGLATESYVDAATAGLATEAYAESYADSLAGDYLAKPPAAVSAGLTLGGSGVQFSASRPTWINVRLTASTILVAQSYTVQLLCDANATPTTVVDDAAGTVIVGELQPAKLTAMVRVGDYCRVVQSAGMATLALTGGTKQLL